MARRVLLALAAPAVVAAALTWSAAADKPQAPPDSRPSAPAEADLTDRLDRRIDFAGIDDPKTTLREALDQLARESGLTFDVNEAAFREEQFEDVLARTVDDRPVPKMKRVTAEHALRKILATIPVPTGATFLVRREAVEITTGAALVREVWPKNYDGPRLPLVNVSFDKKPLAEALKELARRGGMNVVLDARAADRAKVPVTARLLNTPLDTAVRLLADMTELKPYAVDNLFFVTTRENADRMPERLRAMPGGEPDDVDGPPGPYRVGHGPGRRPGPNAAGM
jgi:hypothetical protein